MTTLSLNPRYPGLAHRGALRRASRYAPFSTLSLITGFVSSLRPLKRPQKSCSLCFFAVGGSQLFTNQLQLIHLVVTPLLRQQLLMIALLDSLTTM
ncbi:Uncharacterised protein [Serratia grimesii]|nr:Uncharacterised protein [Serratia grimesii]CAI2470254.1 Uncharacterised protein [Serratia grimesii]SUI31787.1 Uncharacterised protein [Serratia grimesii]